jgi:hypothetical protein
MTPEQQIDSILNDCLLAAGQGIGLEKSVDFEAVVWWRARYRQFFLHAMVAHGNSWAADRHRVTAVGRYLGQRALHHARASATIDIHAAALASHDVETGCTMSAAREGASVAPCTNATGSAFSPVHTATA